MIENSILVKTLDACDPAPAAREVLPARAGARSLRITCVHQGFELYGSDRCFIETVRTIRARTPWARSAGVRPRPGPIVPALGPFASSIAIEPLWILRRKNLARL